MSEESKGAVMTGIEAINNAPKDKRDLIAVMAATYANGLADGIAVSEHIGRDEHERVNGIQ